MVSLRMCKNCQSTCVDNLNFILDIDSASYFSKFLFSLLSQNFNKPVAIFGYNCVSIRLQITPFQNSSYF